MGKLGDILGDEFESKYNEKAQRRREASRKVKKKTLMEICYQAIHGGGFKGEEPRFKFTDDDVDHDVVLMESPQKDLYKFKHSFDNSDNVSFGMFHMGDLWSAIFTEETIELLDKIETDEHYLVVGRYEENVKNAGDEDEKRYQNISPVRGILPLAVAKKYADQYKEQMGGASAEEQSKEQTDSSDSSSSDDDVDLGGLDDSDDGVDKDKVRKVYQTISNKSESLIRDVADGKSDAIEKLITVTNNNLNEPADRERLLDLFEEIVAPIEGRDEEEEEEEDDIDLGGLDDDGEEEDEEEVVEEEEVVKEDDDDKPEETESSDSDDEGDESVDSWF